MVELESIVKSRFEPEFSDFYDDDDGIFSNTGLRSRFNRMRDPFGSWGRKRRGSNQGEAATDIGHDDDSFFPTFQPPWMNDAGSQWNRTTPRKRPQQPAQQTAQQPAPGHNQEEDDDEFFSYIPQEFRQYIPSRFNFPNIRSQFGRQGSHVEPPQSPVRNVFFENANGPQSNTAPPQASAQTKPKFCDAAMQTEDAIDGGVNNNTDSNLDQDQNQEQSQNLNQHGLRNTVDLGQKMRDEVPEEERIPRSHSAPPQQNNQNNNHSSANSFSSSTSNPSGPGPQTHTYAQATPGAAASAFATANCGTDNPNFFRQYYYPFGQRQQRAGQGNQSPPAPQAPPQFQAQTAPPPQQQVPPQTRQEPQQQNQPDGTFVRHVPIVIESRKVPSKPKPQPNPQQPPTAPPTQPQQSHPQERQVPIQTQSPPQTRPQEKSQTHNEPPQSDQSDVPKPVPVKNDSISKIQAIQKEVMELMLAVEKFKGNTRTDKEYIWLDEMLTRNLIKLDDIETDGKENIRLARKEAIKCIQASLCVLEMKADGVIPDEQKQTTNENNTQQQNDEQQQPNEMDEKTVVKNSNVDSNNKNEKDKIIDEITPEKTEIDENKNVDDIPKPVETTSTSDIAKPESTITTPILSEHIDKDDKQNETDEQQNISNDAASAVDALKKKKIIKKIIVKKSIPPSTIANETQSDGAADVKSSLDENVEKHDETSTDGVVTVTADQQSENINDEAVVKTTNTDAK